MDSVTISFNDGGQNDAVQAFNSANTNNDAALSFSELLSGVESGAFKNLIDNSAGMPNADLAAKIYQAADADHNGSIDKQEFQNFIQDGAVLPQSAAFSVGDQQDATQGLSGQDPGADASGDATQGLGDTGGDNSAGGCDGGGNDAGGDASGGDAGLQDGGDAAQGLDAGAFQVSDLNGDGVIDWRDAIEAMLADLKNGAEKIDTNGDGKIDKGEADKIAQQLGGGMTGEQLIGMADGAGGGTVDGSLSKDELGAFMSQIGDLGGSQLGGLTINLQ